MKALRLSSKQLAHALLITLLLGIGGGLLLVSNPSQGFANPEIATSVASSTVVPLAHHPVPRSVSGAAPTPTADWLGGLGRRPVISSSDGNHGSTSAIPPPKSSLQQSWQLRYFEDFSNPNSGWPIDDNPDREFSYYNGEYRIFLKSDNYWAMVRAGPSLGDAAVEVEARLATNLFGTYGLLFGINDDWSQVYTFEADSRGTYRIWKWDALQERWTLIRERGSTHINPGQEVNRLRVERVGNQVSFYANGHFLTTEHIPSLLGEERQMGITAWSYETRQADVRFDNFKIFSAVEPSPTATTPTPILTQTPTGPPTPTVTEVTPGELIFEDNFSDPTSGWPTGEDENTTLEYLRGEYRIRIKRANWYSGGSPGLDFSDFALEADARFTSSSPGAYALLFGIDDEWGWYGFWVSSDGYYAIYKHIGATNDWQELQAWTYSSLINQGLESNHLRAIRDGARIDVYVNGEYLSTVTDSTFTGSLRVGLAAETFDQVGTDARFDDFRVYSLEVSPEVSLTPTATPTPSVTPTKPSTSVVQATTTPTETATMTPSGIVLVPGTWSGTTNQGHALSFIVRADSLAVTTITYKITFSCTGGNVTTEGSVGSDWPIEDNQVDVYESLHNLHFYGTFTSATAVRGTWSASFDSPVGFCNGSGTWQAAALTTPTPPSTPTPTATVPHTEPPTQTSTPIATVTSTPGTKGYLPLIMRIYPPVPDVPVLNDISDPEGDGNYTVSWSPAARAVSYTLQEDADGSFPNPRVIYSGAGTSTTVTGGGPGTYYYRVKATNSFGDSLWSQTKSVTVTPLTPTPSPTPTPISCPEFRAGRWEGFADFTVSSDQSRVEDFEVEWFTGTCGTWRVNVPELPINNCQIEFESSGGGAIRLSISGTFTSEEEMQGSAFVLTSTCAASASWWSWWVSGME